MFPLSAARGMPLLLGSGGHRAVDTRQTLGVTGHARWRYGEKEDRRTERRCSTSPWAASRSDITYLMGSAVVPSGLTPRRHGASMQDATAAAGIWLRTREALVSPITLLPVRGHTTAARPEPSAGRH